ncbi:4-(cytidine 5'-diphospho)-2-C-methyl-D-erythritol kinase [Oryzicola mucosus]|uniref:4-(cytidine 5'-diphospho)-2-C-methyl-D-erythritol kinase n=1 Tax=Oryzicola mucosus TaxID=2767425 RepID=UPI0038B39A9E
MTLQRFSVAEHAPAKINLALHVVGRRDDGYHLLESLVVFTAFGDRIVVSPAEEDSFVVRGHFAAHVPLDDGNLVLRARDALRAAFPEQSAGPVAIELEKHLPAASGIGGGSSDAAATLRALDRFWNLGAGEARLQALGLPLGADLPMCVAARPLIAAGIGEHTQMLDAFPPLHIVLVNPGVAVGTPDVFRALTQRDNPPLPPFDTADALQDWLHRTRNDLEQPARSVAAEIGETLDALKDHGAGFARMSGSGATCFGLFTDAAAAEAAAAGIAEAWPYWFVAATQTLHKDRD